MGSAVALVRRALADTALAPAPYPALDPARYGSQYVVTSTGVAGGAGAARLTGEQALAAVRQIQARIPAADTSSAYVRGGHALALPVCALD